VTTEFRKDEYKKVLIPFGFNEKLERFMLSLFHTFFVAMTGHGKTLGMKSLLFRFHELFPDWKILIIDSKDKRDYADLNADIPICFVETTDPLDLKNLLEPIVGAKLMYYFDKIIEEAVFDTLGEIQRSIHQKVVDADEGRVRIHSKELGKLRVLDYTMGKLVALVEKPNIISELKLHDGFNVMPIALPDVKNPNLKRAFQQLITRSVLILLLSDPSLEKTLLVLDEVHKWSPQKWASICKQPLSEFVSEGRSQDKMLWESDQALTKVDKEPLKNIKIWVVGQQMEANEVEDAKNTVNDITDLVVTENDIKTLKVGNFIVVDGLHGKVERAYLQPYNVPDGLALKIAGGADPELAESYIREFESRSLSQGDEEMYRQKFEHLQEEFEKLQEKYSKLQDDFESLTDGSKELKKQFEDAVDQVKALKLKLEKFEAFQKTFQNLFDLASATPVSQSEAGVKITVGMSLTEISLEDNAPQEVSMTTLDPSGKLMYCAVRLHERKLKEKGKADDKPITFTTAELQKEAAEHGWGLTNMMVGKTTGFLIREAYLIKEDSALRLPKELKINVKESEQE
jgi:hypothetical protein